MTAAIEVRGVSKRYLKVSDERMLLRSLLPFGRPPRTPFEALRDIDLTIDEGETVGIIGRNGSGKTTLLRLIAGVSQPSAGAVVTRGRVAPLISVGVGFHQEMSGRENVLVNGMLLGLSASQVRARFDEIVGFAELEDFIDTPVKFYSSGMFMRLGFSVAVHADPRILLVDEVLAVGDMAFQAKCLEAMRALQRKGTSIVLVSHIMSAVRLLCPRVVVLRDGSIAYDGDPETAMGEYYASGSAPTGRTVTSAAASVTGQHLTGVVAGQRYVEHDGELELVTNVAFHADVASPHIVFDVVSETGIVVATARSRPDPGWRDFKAGEEVEIKVRLRTRLGGGGYRLVTSVWDERSEEQLLRDDGPLIYVSPRLGTWGVADVFPVLEVDGQDLSWPESLMLDAADPASPGQEHPWQAR